MNAYSNPPGRRPDRTEAAALSGERRIAQPQFKDPPKSAGRTLNPRITALLSGIVLCIVLFMMITMQRTAYVAVCDQMDGGSSTSVCFGNGAREVMEEIFSDPISQPTTDTELLARKALPDVPHVREALDMNGSPDLDAVYFGFLGMIASAALVLIVISGLPGEQVQFAGSFTKSGARVKVAGAIGLVTVFAAISFLYSWTALPNSARIEASNDAIEGLMEENAYLRSAIQERVSLFDRARVAYDKSVDETYAGLVRHMRNESGNFARSILENGYFASLNGQFSVRCWAVSDPDKAFGQPDELMIHVPQAAANDRRLEAGSFDLSFKPLKDALAEQASGAPPSREPDMQVQLKDRAEDLLLAQLGYSITSPANASRPNERKVVMQGYLDRVAIDAYCDGQQPAGEAIANVALPDAMSGGRRF
ncbi:hypothetical protein N9H93_00595 [Rhizobiaceae bacterium]|nr:hypothetical protein [Rhizobiaceae bacterium]